MPNNKVNVIITFDVEDPITPESDDAALWLAKQLRDQCAPAGFFLTGDKVRALRERGRKDVLKALQWHDIGYHTDRHSVHPTISEYLEDKSWDDGVREVVTREAVGVDLVRDTLERELVVFATPGTAWAPQVPAALAELGIASHIHSFSRTGDSHNPHWYAGSVCFARNEAVGPVEDCLLDDEKFRAMLDRIPQILDRAERSESRLMHLFIGHPARFVTTEYWDAINYGNGRNPQPGAKLVAPKLRSNADVITMLKNLRRFVEVVQSDQRTEIVPLSEVLDAVDVAPAREGNWLDQEISRAASIRGIRTVSSLTSPAQLLYAMCGKLIGATDTELPELHGPVAAEQAKPNSATQVSDGQLRKLAGKMHSYATATRTVPHEVYADGVTITLGTLYRTLVDLGAAQQLCSIPRHIALSTCDEMPEIAGEIVEHFERRSRRWLHKPDLNTAELSRLTAAQTWSLRPAVTS